MGETAADPSLPLGDEGMVAIASAAVSLRVRGLRGDDTLSLFASCGVCRPLVKMDWDDPDGGRGATAEAAIICPWECGPRVNCPEPMLLCMGSRAGL